MSVGMSSGPENNGIELPLISLTISEYKIIELKYVSLEIQLRVSISCLLKKKRKRKEVNMPSSSYNF